MTYDNLSRILLRTAVAIFLIAAAIRICTYSCNRSQSDTSIEHKADTIRIRDTIHCFLDNDQAGRKTVESISNVFEYRVTDESFRYADYKDVNDYLMRKKRTASE